METTSFLCGGHVPLPDLLSKVGICVGQQRIVPLRPTDYRQVPSLPARRIMSADIIKGIPFLDTSFHRRTITQLYPGFFYLYQPDHIMRLPGLLSAPDFLPFLVFVVPP